MDFLNKISLNNDPSTAKNKQLIFKIILAIGFAIIIYSIMELMDDNESVNNNQSNKVKVNKNIVNENEMTKSIWLGEASSDIAYINKQFKDIKEKNKEIEKNNKETNLKIKQILDYLKNKEKSEERKVIEKKEKDIKVVDGQIKFFPVPPTPQNKIEKDGVKNKFLTPVKKESKRITPMSDVLNVFDSPQEQIENNNIKKKSKELEMLPSGSITKVTLLSGFDAPTMA